MSQSGCPQCGGPISFRDSNFAPYICSKCKTENKRASQTATLEAVRRFEDRTFDRRTLCLGGNPDREHRGSEAMVVVIAIKG